MSDFEVFCVYLSIKNHFTKKSYDYFKYHGKVTAKIETFYNRKDRFYFERLSRKLTKNQVVDYFVSNYVESSDPTKVWVGDLKSTGNANYEKWLKRKESLDTVFATELESLVKESHLLDCITSEKNKHPLVLKNYLKKELCIETLIILDDLIHFGKSLNDEDIIWSGVKQLMEKYRPFFNYNKETYTGIIRKVCLTKN